MPEEFREGQRIVVEQLISSEDEFPVPPGRYVIVKVTHDLLGSARCWIRSLPDEDLEVEVDLSELSASARISEEP